MCVYLKPESVTCSKCLAHFFLTQRENKKKYSLEKNMKFGFVTSSGEPPVFTLFCSFLSSLLKRAFVPFIWLYL